VTAGLDDLAQLHVQALDRIGGVEDATDIRRESEERDHPRPDTPPGRGDSGIALAPWAGGKFAQGERGHLVVERGVDRSQRLSNRPAVLVADDLEAIADQVDDAGLHRRLREHRFNGFREAFQAIDDRNQHVFNTARAQVVEHLEPELGAFGLLDP